MIARLNPRDGDEAEVSLLIAAVGAHHRLRDVAALHCSPALGLAPCGRCAALGQWKVSPLTADDRVASTLAGIRERSAKALARQGDSAEWLGAAFKSATERRPSVSSLPLRRY